MSSNGSGGGGASRVEHMVAGLVSGTSSPTRFNAYVDGAHMLTREAPDFQQGLVMLSSTLAELGRDGWRLDTVVDTGYEKTVFLSRESNW